MLFHVHLALEGIQCNKKCRGIRRRLEHITTPMTLSVIGCVVNGPGEARETNIGLTGGKSGHQIYLDGEKHHILRDGDMIDHLVSLCEKKQKELQKKAEKLQKLNTVKGTKDHYGQMAINYDFVLGKFKMFCDFFNFEKFLLLFLNMKMFL